MEEEKSKASKLLCQAPLTSMTTGLVRGGVCLMGTASPNKACRTVSLMVLPRDSPVNWVLSCDWLVVGGVSIRDSGSLYPYGEKSEFSFSVS